MPKNLLIRGGRLIDPSAGVDETADLLIESGRVSRIGLGLSAAGQECEIVDAAGLIVAPGLVDPHVHFREPGFTHKETIATGSRAAARGGFTTVICEPNTNPPIDTPKRVDEFAQRARGSAIIRVYAKACITRGAAGEELTDIAALREKPQCAAISDDGNPVIDDGVMQNACVAAAKADIVVSPHAEDSELARRAYASTLHHPLCQSPPYRNEPHYVERDIAAAEAARCRIHFSHISLADSMGLIDEAKGRGRTRVTCEATPHHLALCAEDATRLGPNGVMNPPLRSRAEMEALRRAFIGGRIDCIATDHAPHTTEEKQRGAMGVIGLETALGVIMTTFVKPQRISIPQLVARMSLQPAKIFGLRAGTLAVGASADVVLIDAEAQWVVDPGRFQSKGRNCPFAGWQLTGQAVTTIVGGTIVMRDGEIFAPPAEH